MKSKYVFRTAPAFVLLDGTPLDEISELASSKFVLADITLRQQGTFPEFIYTIQTGMVKLVCVCENAITAYDARISLMFSALALYKSSLR